MYTHIAPIIELSAQLLVAFKSVADLSCMYSLCRWGYDQIKSANNRPTRQDIDPYTIVCYVRKGKYQTPMSLGKIDHQSSLVCSLGCTIQDDIQKE